MTALLFGFDDFIKEWTAERIPAVSGFDNGAHGIGIINDDRLLAGVVYHFHDRPHRTIQLTVASESPMWAKRPIISGFLRYAFDGLGVYKVWTCTPIESKKTIRINEKCGFKREATLSSQFGPKHHAVICRMLQPDFHRIYGVK